MQAKNLQVGMRVKMSNYSSIIQVQSQCDGHWFKGKVIDLNGSKEDEYNYLGYESEFNIDFATQV